METVASLGIALITLQILSILDPNSPNAHAVAVFLGTVVYTIVTRYFEKRTIMRKVETKTDEAKTVAEEAKETVPSDVERRISALEAQLHNPSKGDKNGVRDN